MQINSAAYHLRLHPPRYDNNPTIKKFFDLDFVKGLFEEVDQSLIRR